MDAGAIDLVRLNFNPQTLLTLVHQAPPLHGPGDDPHRGLSRRQLFQPDDLPFRGQRGHVRLHDRRLHGGGHIHDPPEPGHVGRSQSGHGTHPAPGPSFPLGRLPDHLPDPGHPPDPGHRHLPAVAPAGGPGPQAIQGFFGSDFSHRHRPDPQGQLGDLSPGNRPGGLCGHDPQPAGPGPGLRLGPGLQVAGKGRPGRDHRSGDPERGLRADPDLQLLRWLGRHGRHRGLVGGLAPHRRAYRGLLWSRRGAGETGPGRAQSVSG